MAKESVTIRLEGELIAGLEREAEEEGVSRSEYVRQILRERGENEELQEEISALRERLEGRERRVRELEEQLARRSNIEEKVDTLAKRQETSNAPFFVKWYHWLQERE